jgi:thiol-disulfide isomerase/thioredoxin
MSIVYVVAAVSWLAMQQPPATISAPSDCLRRVEDVRAKKQKEAPRPLTSEVFRKIDAEKTAMAKECAVAFDVKTLPAEELPSLIRLYGEAGQPVAVRSAIEHGLATLKGPKRGELLAIAISSTLRSEPKSPERNARLERLVDELDALPDAAFEQKFSAHNSLNGYYRADDIDAGILKHSTWIMDSARTMTSEQRKRYGHQIGSAYRNAAQALSGQGKNDDALQLLRRGRREFAEVPDFPDDIDREIERYMLVGTPAEPIKAPLWLNAPAGTAEMPMTGHVTLLEFTAHWCGPCRESYPGINRLLAKYEPSGFRVVLATQLYGYFGSERNLDAAAEAARDREYFAKHEMSVPVAIGTKNSPPFRNADGTTTFQRDPNDESYKVGGIPQIHLIDKKGRIRLIMIGYDDANEPKLAEMIEKLLGER